MADENIKLVDFHTYCPLCMHFKNKEEDDPCDECLAVGGQQYSQRPIKFLAKVTSQKKQII